MPKVLVILAAYNGIRWIEAQLDSILSQSGVDVTVVLSVDPSSDGTEGWVRQVAARDDRVVLLPTIGGFGGAARNFFRLVRDVDLSEYDYLAFADQDDVWCEEKLIGAHDKIKGLGVSAYSSNVLAVWADGREKLIRKSQPQRRWDYLFESAGPGCTFVFRRDLAEAVQRLVRGRWSDVNEVWRHDWLFYAFARANGYSWFIDDRATVRYRQHEANQVGANSGWVSLKERLGAIRSGAARRQSQRVADIVGLEQGSAMSRALHGGWKGSLFLACNANHARRSFLARIGFFFLCVLNQL